MSTTYNTSDLNKIISKSEKKCIIEKKNFLTHIPKSKLLNRIFDNINVDSDLMLKKYKDRELV